MRSTPLPPFMTVVVCAYNSEHVIARALESLLAQDYPEERYEIIVVDDGSYDRTSEIAGKYPVGLVRHDRNRGLAAARNSGLAHTKGDIYVSFDDDLIADPDWLQQLAYGYALENVAGVGGKIRERAGLHGIAGRYLAASGSADHPSLRLGASTNPLRRFRAYVADQLSAHQQSTRIHPVRELNGATATFPVDILHSVGGWDESLRAAEDNDLCARIAERYSGLIFYAVPNARVVHDPRMSLWKFLRRPYSRGLDTLRYYRRNGLVPPIFPYPFAWLGGVLLAGLRDPFLSPIAVAVLPQLLYVWWPVRAIRKRDLRYLLYTYLQLAEESATVLGLLRGHILSRKTASLPATSASSEAGET